MNKERRVTDDPLNIFREVSSKFGIDSKYLIENVKPKIYIKEDQINELVFCEAIDYEEIIEKEMDLYKYVEKNIFSISTKSKCIHRIELMIHRMNELNLPESEYGKTTYITVVSIIHLITGCKNPNGLLLYVMYWLHEGTIFGQK